MIICLLLLDQAKSNRQIIIYQITTADAVSDSDFYPFRPEAKVVNNIYHPRPCPSVLPCNAAVSCRTKNALRLQTPKYVPV